MYHISKQSMNFELTIKDFRMKQLGSMNVFQKWNQKHNKEKILFHKKRKNLKVILIVFKIKLKNIVIMLISKQEKYLEIQIIIMQNMLGKIIRVRLEVIRNRDGKEIFFLKLKRFKIIVS